MKISSWVALALLGLGASACSSDPSATKLSSSAGTAASTAAPPPSSSASATASTATSSVARDLGFAQLPAGPMKCGDLECQVFATPADALKHVLDTHKPLLLALGESHALKGGSDVKSTTARFTEELIPVLEGRAASLVLELWVASGKCGKEKEAAVATQQKEVTAPQKEENQNEFVVLGHAAKAAGITPDILRPTCEEYDAIQKAGDNGVIEMLKMITTHMKTKALKLLGEAKQKSSDKMVVTYGGAIHNDLAPRPGREDWSFAPAVDKAVEGKLVELDMIVPEFIKADSDSWRAMPWFAAYDREKMAGSTVLIKTGPKSYALLFARSTPL